jgi:hypothetical protein
MSDVAWLPSHHSRGVLAQERRHSHHGVGMQVTLVCAAWVKFAYSTPICISVTIVSMFSFFSWAYVQHNWAPYVPHPRCPTLTNPSHQEGTFLSRVPPSEPRGFRVARNTAWYPPFSAKDPL